MIEAVKVGDCLRCKAPVMVPWSSSGKYGMVKLYCSPRCRRLRGKRGRRVQAGHERRDR